MFCTWSVQYSLVITRLLTKDLIQLGLDVFEININIDLQIL